MSEEGGEPQRSTVSESDMEAGYHKMLAQLQQAEGDGQGSSTIDAGGQQGRPSSAATGSSGHAAALDVAPQHRSADVCSFDESEWQTAGKQAVGATSLKHQTRKQAPPAAVKVCLQRRHCNLICEMSLLVSAAAYFPFTDH